MKKEIHLSIKNAEKIVNAALTIANARGITGSVAIVDTDNNYIYGVLTGYESPMVYAIAANRFALSEYDSAHTETISPEIATLPTGGCPIYTQDGIHVGGAGFSEHFNSINKQIMSEAIKTCGFASHSPSMENNMDSNNVKKRSEK